MSLLKKICNCTYCDCSGICNKLYDNVLGKGDKLSPSQIFSREGIIAARPSLALPLGGKFESFDYEPNENPAFIRQEVERGYSFVTIVFFLRCLMVILTGFVIGITGAAAEITIYIITCYKGGYLRSLIKEDYEKNTYNVFIWGAIFNCSLAMVGSVLVIFFEPSASGGGIAGIMGILSGVKVKKSVDFRVYVVKLISFICMGAAGLPGGKEGPMIHLGTIVGSCLPMLRIPFTTIKVFSPLTNDKERRDFAVAGVAAGLAGAFATPIASMLMAVEEFMAFWSGDLCFRIFVCSVVSATSFNFFISWFHGNPGEMKSEHVLFLHSLHESNIESYSFSEIPVFIVIGLIGAILGCIWIYIHRMMIFIRQRFLKFKVLQLLEVIFWTLATTMIHCITLLKLQFCSKKVDNLPHLCSKETSTMNLQLYCSENEVPTMGLFSLQGNDQIFGSFLSDSGDLIPLYPQLIMFAIYYFMSGLFSGSMISAGLFIPNMVNGAAMGRCFALLVEAIWKEEVWWARVQNCAFYGSAALLSGVIRLTFSVAVLYCEGASNMILLFPITIVLLSVKILADIIIDGVYEVQYSLAAIPILSRHPPPHAVGLNAADVMSQTNLIILNNPTTIRKLIQVSFESRHNGFPVVDSKFITKNDNEGGSSVGRLVGLVRRSEILNILKKQWFEDAYNIPENTKRRYRRDVAEILGPKTANSDNKPALNLDLSVNLENNMDIVPFVVKWNSSLNRTYRLFNGIGLRHLIVVNNTNEVIGIITRKDLAKYKTVNNILGVKVHSLNFT